MAMPGGEFSKKVLSVFLLIDSSASMAGEKIQTTITALREIMPVLQEIEDENGEVEIMIMALTFSSTVEWIIPQMTRISDVQFPNITTNGSTSMGLALIEVSKHMTRAYMGDTCSIPVVLIITDGMATDNFPLGLKEFNNSAYGQLCIRAAIGIGDDCSYETLNQFLGNPELTPMRADNPEELKDRIYVATLMSVVKAISPAETAGALPKKTDQFSLTKDDSLNKW